MLGRRVILGALPVLVLGLAVGCGNPQGGPPKVAVVKAGDMPEGGEWTGVYYSASEGYLHLIKEGGSVNAKWRTVAGDVWGELHGEVTGDLLKFEWKDHKIGLVGPGTDRGGRGYFKYVKGAEQDEIVGEYGLGSDEIGTTWKATKQRNMVPDPDSVLPDEVEGRTNTNTGGWDEGQGEGGEGEGEGEGGEEGGGDEGGEEAPPDPPIR